MKLAILETGRPPGELGRRVRRLSGDVRAACSARGSRSRISTCRRASCPTRGAHARLSDHRIAGGRVRAAAVDRAAARASSARPIGQQDGRHLLRPPGRWPRRSAGRSRNPPRAGAPGCTATTIVRDEPWIDGVAEIAIPASHQDQVVVQPPNTEVVAASDFTPFAGAGLDRPPGDLLPVPSRNSRPNSPRR